MEKMIKFLCPDLMKEPNSLNVEDFLAYLLKYRPPFVILWDVEECDVIFFKTRVWVVQYLIVKDKNVIFFESHYYAKLVKKILKLDTITIAKVMV